MGPIGILCIRRTLRHGVGAGFASGMGAATADAVYGSVAAFGVTAVSRELQHSQPWLGLLGGIFLRYLGVRTFLSKLAAEAAPWSGISPLAAFSSTLVLTLANPATLLSFVAIFAAFNLGAGGDFEKACGFVLGVFLGSALWRLILCVTLGLIRSKDSTGGMKAINWVSGATLIAFGIFA